MFILDEVNARLAAAEARSADNERRIRALSEALDRLEKDAASASHVVAARNGEISRLRGEVLELQAALEESRGETRVAAKAAAEVHAAWKTEADMRAGREAENKRLLADLKASEERLSAMIRRRDELNGTIQFLRQENSELLKDVGKRDEALAASKMVGPGESVRISNLEQDLRDEIKRSNAYAARNAHLEWVIESALDAASKIPPFIRNHYIPKEQWEREKQKEQKEK